MINFAKFVNLKNKLSSLFSGKKKSTVICFLIIVLIVGYMISINLKPSSKQSDKEDNVENFSISDYSNNIENKLESMLLNIDEIDSVSVMVMVESTPKTEYLTETEQTTETDEKGSSSTTSTSVVFEKDGSVSTPVVVTTIMPKIIGVLIVVNKISASTKFSIINSISMVLNVDSSSISILQKG